MVVSANMHGLLIDFFLGWRIRGLGIEENFGGRGLLENLSKSLSEINSFVSLMCILTGF